MENDSDPIELGALRAVLCEVKDKLGRVASIGHIEPRVKVVIRARESRGWSAVRLKGNGVSRVPKSPKLYTRTLNL